MSDMQSQVLAGKLSRRAVTLERIGSIVIVLYMATALFAFVIAPQIAILWIRQPDLFHFGETSLSSNIKNFLLLSGSLNSTQILITHALLPYLIAIVIFGIGIWVFALRHRDFQGKVLGSFTTSAALAVLLYFDAITTARMTHFWLFNLAVAGGSLISLSFIFPSEEQLTSRRPLFHWVGYILGLAIFGYSTLIWFYNSINPVLYLLSYRFSLIFLYFGFFFFLGWKLFRYKYIPEPKLREQNRLALIGVAICIFPSLTWLLVAQTPLKFAFSPLLIVPFMIFPLSIAYSLTRSRQLHTDFIASQVLLYSLLTFLAAAGYGLLITGASLVTNNYLRLDNPFLAGVSVFLLVLVFLPLRERLQKNINKAFGHDQETYRQKIQAFSHALTQAMDIENLNLLLRDYLDKSLVPSHIHIFLNHPGSNHYAALPDTTGQQTSDLLFYTDSGLISVLSSRRAAIYLGNPESIPSQLIAEQARLALLGSHVFIPLNGQQRLIGWIGLGARRSGRLYSQRDMNFLETICDQTALAFERAQVVQDLEQRIHQMNVLTRMTQGINVTTTFDDILELIYAQSIQILPAQDFHIALMDQRSKVLVFAFYLENDERQYVMEKSPVIEGQGIELDVYLQSRMVVTDDYEHECRSRNLIIHPKGIYAWISVPMYTGGDTIGVLSLGSRDPSIMYTREQANLLQAIADQAAGAILKARLLNEAEHRALQLATLNEVAQSLGSTLELVPLFNQILRSAVDLLNCEAGSLLLVDESTGEYVFEAAVGPVADNIIRTRLPSGTGLVGKAINSREAVIANDVRRDKEWSVKTDDNTGFKTNDLLVVPMIYRDEVTGVIEVLNRRDGQPFTSDDQELLSAFTGQAAVALENARLFTLTDQTLTERVEELSVLQRIDRELNISLDIERALRVTLDWAMLKTRADAGLIGILKDEKIRVMASRGYNADLNHETPEVLPISMPSIQKALETGQPLFIDLNEENINQRQAILPGAQQQIVVTLRREAQVIGLVLLECLSVSATEDENFGFLSRLSDHASVAITNASLYTEVQEANQAKSDFVSFVSHELKTPMTSIRGFSDLLASGVVGPINENQANFLNTIRSNVDRMATLVSDLTDISRIEAGRLHLDFGAIPFDEVVDEVVRSTRTQILEKKQTLIVNTPQDLPNMWGDRVRIIQILTNLVSNAYKYTQVEGLIQINAQLAENEWTEGSPQVIHVSVIDNGFGISPENQEKIFQKFFRSDDQKVRDTPGTGLGLNITKQLVEFQGGAIWFESDFRKGTTFHFTVPISESV
jgi:signal transduction histidine kinase